jgi:tetratricopeptide (TPR) repeat protein
METDSPKQKFALIKQALELDPENTDSRLWLLRNSDIKGDVLICELRRIVDTAARRLGGEFKEYAGQFWGFIETRPYMRAREMLAHELLALGQMEESAKEFEGMLELNPGDNQGVRYTLLACYLSLNRLAEVRRLFKQFRFDLKYSLMFAWGNVLLRWLSPRKAGLEKALAAARKQNAHAEDYITGKQKLPKQMPPFYSKGSKEEAACFAQDLMRAWAPHPGALEWLRQQSAVESEQK